MKEAYKRVLKHPLISGSAIVLFGSLIGNVFNFLFNVFMSRNLAISEYGILASLVSLITLCTFATESFTPAIVHAAAEYFATGNITGVKKVFYVFLKIFLILGFIFCMVFTIFSQQISIFFKIPNSLLLIVVGLCVWASFVYVINRSLLQAELSFFFIGLISCLGPLLKLLFGGAFVLRGWGVAGALSSFLLSIIIPYILTFIPLKRIFIPVKEQTIQIQVKHILSYGMSAALSLFFLTFFVTMDVLLVKHFFTPVQAGLYAGISLIGRVIYFLSAPIGLVMFPLIVQKKAKNQQYHRIFQLSILLVLLPSLIITCGYFLFPHLVIKIFLKNNSYQAIAPYIGMYGLLISLYSVLSVLTNFYLSIKKTDIFLAVFLGVMLQALGIILFHKTFFQVIIASFIGIGFSLLLLLVYYWKIYAKTI